MIRVLRCLWGIAIATTVIAVSAGCSDRQADTPRGTTVQSVTGSDIDRALDFEAMSTLDWSVLWSGPGTLSSSTDASHGSRSLSVLAKGNVQMRSVPLSSLESRVGSQVGSTLDLDVRLPINQANAYWYGNLAVAVDIPSLGVYSAPVGSTVTLATPLGQWSTISFPLSVDLQNKLRSTYSDLTFTLSLTVDSNTTEAYGIDNLRFSGGSTPGIDGGTGSTDAGTSPPASGKSATVMIPFSLGVTRDTVAVGANGSLRLNDRNTVLDGESGRPMAVFNGGSALTEIGADAKVGSVTSRANVTLRERASISGNLVTGGSLVQQNGVSISGTTSKHETLNPANEFSWTIRMPSSNSGNVSLEPDQDRAITPGAYGNVMVKSRAKLRLRSGVYYLSSFDLEPNSQLFLDKTNGPVVVYVTGYVKLQGGQLVDQGGPQGDFLLVCLGPDEIFVEQQFTGTIVAPNAKLSLGSIGSAPFRGTFFARDFESHQDNTIIRLPFSWGKRFGDCAQLGCGLPGTCHTEGVCDVATGVCSNPNAMDRLACSSGNPCIKAEQCLRGICQVTQYEDCGTNCGNQSQCDATGQCVSVATPTVCGAWSQPKPNEVIVWQEPSFTGTCRTLPEGSYQNSSSFYPVADNTISSLKVGCGVRAMLFQDPATSNVPSTTDTPGFWYSGHRATYEAGTSHDLLADLAIFRLGPGVENQTSAIVVEPEAGKRIAYNFLGDYPNDSDDPPYAEQPQGIAHGPDSWYITNTWAIFRIPLVRNLDQSGYDGLTCLTDRSKGSIWGTKIPEWLEEECAKPKSLPKEGLEKSNHIGDPDFAADPDYPAGFLFVPMEGCKECKAQVAAYRADTLELVGVSLLDTGTAAWVAIDPKTRKLWTADSNHVLRRYDVDWHSLVNSTTLVRGFLKPIDCSKESCSSRDAWPNMLDPIEKGPTKEAGGQGGVFDPEGKILYLSSSESSWYHGIVAVGSPGTELEFAL